MVTELGHMISSIVWAAVGAIMVLVFCKTLFVGYTLMFGSFEERCERFFAFVKREVKELASRLPAFAASVYDAITKFARDVVRGNSVERR